MGGEAVEGLSVRVKIAVALALAIVLVGIAAVVVVIGQDPVEASDPGDVQPGRENVVESDDGSVVVTIPGDAVQESGTLTIERVRRQHRDGWRIELDGTELTGTATIAFPGLDLQEGEPTPLVSHARKPGARLRIADQVSVEAGSVVVTTDHFSTWYVDRWADLLGTTTRWAAERLDATFSVSEDRAPRCDGEDEIREAGYEISSDSGQRVFWCLGLVGEAPVLKVVNGRGYGVATEHTPGLDVVRRDHGGLLDITAELLTPPATRDDNTVVLQGAGDQVDLGVSPTAPRMGVMVQPDPGAYLLSALDFAVATYTMVMERVGVRGATDKLLSVLEGQQCLGSFTDMATTELATPQQAQEFFTQALEMSFDCVALSATEVDLGVLNQAVVGPVVWLLSGVRTATDGLVAAADIVLDVDGYRIEIDHAIAPEVTEEIVEDLLVPAGTCGTDEIGWDQVEPIQLRGGEGEAFDDDLHGAGVLESALVGAVDVTGDGAEEAVVSLKCTGSPKEMCCAGRTSSLDFIAVLDLTGEVPRRVGDTITPTMPEDSSGTAQSRAFDGNAATLEGATVVTYQTLVYPEQVSRREVPQLEGEVRYELSGDRWVATEG